MTDQRNINRYQIRALIVEQKGTGMHRSRRARQSEPIMGVSHYRLCPWTPLGAVPTAGSRGRAPGQGVRRQSPPEAEAVVELGF